MPVHENHLILPKHLDLGGHQFGSFLASKKSDINSKNIYHRIAVDSDHFCLHPSIDWKSPSLAKI